MGHFLHYLDPNIQKESRRIEHLNMKIIQKEYIYIYIYIYIQEHKKVNKQKVNRYVR